MDENHRATGPVTLSFLSGSDPELIEFHRRALQVFGMQNDLSGARAGRTVIFTRAGSPDQLDQFRVGQPVYHLRRGFQDEAGRQ
jgi:hypothetical protein